MSAALSIRDLAAGYAGFDILRNFDLDIPAGSLTAIIGPNGAGKTTLLNALGGLMPRRGDVRLDGTPLTAGRASATAKAGVALVAEGRQLFPAMSVRDNIEIGGWLVPRAERAERIVAATALFPRLIERRDQLAQSLSGGEQQMLAIARALVGKPRLLMLDEPSIGLAPKMVDELLSIICRIRDQGVTVLLVEQNVAKALSVADRAHVLERGRLVAGGTAAELLNSDLVRSAYLGVV